MSDTTQTSAPGQTPQDPQVSVPQPASQPATLQPATAPRHPRLLPLPARIRRAMSGSWAMLIATLILLATAVIGLIPSFNAHVR